MTTPLQNRVTPFGDIVATAARGTLMGNRGGRLHDEGRRLGAKRWTSKRWICRELAFKGLRRTVMAPDSYTELFFLDEVTALAAGHRPCFECRRADAKAFAAFPADRLGADAIDDILHAERLARHDIETVAGLPDGCSPRPRSSRCCATAMSRAGIDKSVRSPGLNRPGPSKSACSVPRD